MRGGPVMVDSMIQLPQMEKQSGVEQQQQQEQHPFVPCFKKGEFPPPLPLLARKSYNHLPLQVPWTLLQANRSNNRVVLHEIKAANGAHLMLFQPIRSQGRLVLQMLRHDSDDEFAEETETETETDHEEGDEVLLAAAPRAGVADSGGAASTASSTGVGVDMDSKVE